MPHAQIAKDTWYRRIHDTWENFDGYRTDIASSVLDDPAIKRAVFILDDTRGIIVSMDDLRRILASARRGSTGKVGPFNVNPHTSSVDGVKVAMEIKFPKPKEPNKAPAQTSTTVTPQVMPET